MTTALLPSSDAALGSVRAQRVVLGLHRALDFTDLWRALQKLFETLVPHDTLVMSVNYLDWRREATTRRLHSTHSRVTDEGEYGQLVANEGRNFFQPFLEKNPGIPCYHHTEVMPDAPEKIPETGYYQRYMIPLGWRYSAHLLFWRGGNVETSFALRRRPDQGDFTAEEMDVLRALHPHIAVAFDRVRLYEGELRRRRLLESFYRARPEAVLFLNWDLEVLYASQEAVTACLTWKLGAEEARLYSPNAVFSVPPQIIEACAALKPQWQPHVQGTDSTGPALLALEVVAENSPASAANISLRHENGATFSKPVFVVRFRPPGGPALADHHGPPDAALQRRRSELTPAERDLADLVCAGLSNKEIAAHLRRSEGSVKVQLSGIFQKLRVNSRAKLMVALRG